MLDILVSKELFSVPLLTLHLSAGRWVSASGFMSASSCRSERSRRHKSCIFAGRLIQREASDRTQSINAQRWFRAASLISVQAALSFTAQTPALTSSAKPHTVYSVIKIIQSNGWISQKPLWIACGQRRSCLNIMTFHMYLHCLL